MAESDQREVVAFLSRPAAYPGAPAVTRTQTHISLVFLAGSRAYKMKRAVRFDYLDFSTLALRRRYVEAEVRINRRTAPELYLGALAVTRERDGRLALGGSGEPVEWLVEMIRFDASATFDQLALHGALGDELLDQTGLAIAAFHHGAEVRTDPGAGAALSELVDVNARQLAAEVGRTFESGAVASLNDRARAAAVRVEGILDARRAAGFVRRGHGDLHLRNICAYQGRPTLFDAIEFDERLAIIDVLFDLAFLLMDLLHRGLRRAANQVFNKYLEVTRDYDGLAALPIFLSVRAAIRAHVSAAAARTAAAADADRQRGEARSYLNLASELLVPAAPRLIAIGGLSGTGKTTQARRLAPDIGPAPGAVVLRSDVRRKQRLGAAETARLGPEGYRPEVTEAVYRELAADAGRVVAAGHGAVADAVFARPDERAAIEAAARASKAGFTGLWLEAPEAQLQARVSARRNDASDADAGVVARQAHYALGSVDWARIDASGAADQVAARVARVVGAEP